MNTNPSDILELISRGDADPLTSAERAVVDRAIAADPGLARQRTAYARLDALLARFAELPDDVDWESLSGDITAEIRAEATDDVAVASAPIVEQLSRSLPPVDWDAFRTRVSNAVRDEAAQQSSERTIKWPAVFSWVAPLAAAAMIALVVWGPFGVPRQNVGPNPGGVGEPIAVVEVEVARPASTGTVAVSFDETSPADMPKSPSVIPGGTVIVNGSWPTAEPAIETPTVTDVDAYYY